MSKFYRVITFQSKEVINILLQNELYLADITKAREGSICEEDIKACDGKTPIWVFQHPAFCLDSVGIQQFCNMLQTFKEEMSISSLNNLYMIELHLSVQPPMGLAHNDFSCACVIPHIKLSDVAAIYKVLNNGEKFFYDIEVIKTFKDKSLFTEKVHFDRSIYSNDYLPTLSLSKFKNAKEYYDYDKVLRAYVLDIVSSKRLDLSIDDIINKSKCELGLAELYKEVIKMINTKQEKVTDYQKLVRDCNSKSNNAKSLAISLYNKWINLGSTDKDLIGIYKAMSVATFSTYELESLTKKRIIMDENGYRLEDCYHDTNVTLESSTDSNHCVKNANALGILNTYKNKYNISDAMWVNELERLQVLCDSTDIYALADFVETNFL